MKFLLTNDDGYDAEGLMVLRRAINQFGETTIVAPSSEHSGCGHQLTTYSAIESSAKTDNVFAIDGSRADCTRLGLGHFCKDTDWVIAGINRGGNLGVDHYMSGTVSAVREAALLGKPAIALSQFFRSDIPVDWALSRRMAESTVQLLLQRELPTGSFWVVNFPALAASATLPELVDCSADRNPMPLNYQRTDNAFQFESAYFDRPRTAGSDVDVCFSGSISVTLETV